MRYHPEPELASFIQQLPKTETHLHIEGALPWRLLSKLDPKRFAEPPAFWSDDFRYQTFPEFEQALLDHALLWFTAPERYHQAAAEIFAGLEEQNVKYVETSFHLGVVELLKIPGPEIVAAIKSAAPAGMTVRVFVGMLRTHYRGEGARLIEELHTWDGLDGIDLHGLETPPLEPWTRPTWERVRASGRVTKAHAGEFGGADNVRQVVEELGVRRVQHGVRAVEDPAVVQLLVDREVTLDVCPISNVKLKVVPSMDQHPIRQLFDAGVRCTISTDDPMSFGNRLVDEYAALAMDLNFTHQELCRIAANGFEVARMPDPARQAYLNQLNSLALGSS
jgi:adenine deaminase